MTVHGVRELRHHSDVRFVARRIGIARECLGEIMADERAIAIRPETGLADFDSLLRVSRELIVTGFLPAAIKTPQQAAAIILTGRELGIPTMQALRQINVIQGKPTLPPELLLSLAYQRVKGFSADVKESTATRCAMLFKRPGASYESVFTIEDATRMGLKAKDNWQKQPGTMLRWRCIAQGLRVIAPDAIMGIYTPEEMNPDLIVDDEGQVTISSTPVPPKAPTVIKTLPVQREVKKEYASNPLDGPDPKFDASGLPDDVGFPEPPRSPTEQSPSSTVAEPSIVADAAELFQPKSVTTKPAPAKEAKEKKPRKAPVKVQTSADQIDVYGGYMIKEELKAMGFRWNSAVGAWSAPFSDALLSEVEGLVGPSQ